jgi:N-acetylmuramoyl-L-alanine amidase
MKRVISAWIAILLLVGILHVTFGSKFAEYDHVTLKDATTKVEKSFPSVNILLGGNDVITDVPAILFNLNGYDRTLVPVRVISEGLGATVKWDGVTKRVTIQYEGKTIVLTIDSAQATVNGKSYTLPNGVPAKLMEFEGVNRTLVPVRFVSEQLGLDVGWEGATRTAVLNRKHQTVTNIVFSDTAAFEELFIQTTGSVSTSTFYLDSGSSNNDNKLFIDLPNTSLKLTDSNKMIGNTAYLGIFKNGFLSAKGETLSGGVVPTTRFVLDMSQAKGYDVIHESKGVRIRFINTVQSISVEDVKGAKALKIRTAEALPAVNYTESVGKITIDILDSLLKVEDASVESIVTPSGDVMKVTYEQKQGHGLYGPQTIYTSVTIDVPNSGLFDYLYFDPDSPYEVTLYVSENPINTFLYGKNTPSTAQLSIIGDQKAIYESSFNESNRTLTLTLPTSFTRLNAFQLKPNDLIVETVTIEELGQFYRVMLKLADGVEYSLKNSGVETELVEVSFSNPQLNVVIKENVTQGKLIVLDAGHGGKDPGAISKITGMREKDLTLDLALKLRKRLESLGYRVHMIRDYDTYVGNYDRAYIANDLGADVFLSIHGNSFTTATPRGIETLYPNDSRNSLAFARILQNALVSKTNSHSRGVVERNNLIVLRETLMPAALVEVGFLSNPDDAKKLLDAHYIQLIVEGMTEGIVQYLSK